MKMSFKQKFTIVVLCLIWSQTEAESNDGFCEKDVCHPKDCITFDLKNFGPDNTTIIYGEAKGRLGNQLLGYMVMFQLRRQLNVNTYIDSVCKDYVSNTFVPENVQLPVLSEYFCNPQDLPFEPYSGSFAELLTNEKYRKGKILYFYPPDKNNLLKSGYKPEDHIGPEQEAFQKAYLNYLQENFRFKPHIVTRVNKTLKKMAKKMGKKTKEMTYVGIHNRRTDHFDFVRLTSGQEPLDKHYFYDAMEYFREEYENVAFAYVSDDMAWGRKNLKNKHGDLFFVGAGENLGKDGKDSDPDAVTFDLALLASCNHSIITRGTFSMWAGLLARGEYYTEYGSIVPTHLQ